MTVRFWEELAWQTTLSLADCSAQLRTQTEPDTWPRWLVFRSYDTGTLFRSIDGRSFRLYAKGSPFVRNSFEPFFYGALSEVQGRAVIHGSFRIHSLPLILMTMWLVAVTTIGGLTLLACAMQLITGRQLVEGSLPPWGGLIAGPILFLFGTGLVALGWWMGRPQRRIIRGFIETTLQGQLLPAGENGRALFKASMGS